MKRPCYALGFTAVLAGLIQLSAVGDVVLRGVSADTLTLTSFNRHKDIPIGAATLGPTAPSFTTVGNARCAIFNQSASAEAVYSSFEVPSDWDGSSDIEVELYWSPESGDAVADTEVVEFDVSYTSTAEGEAIDAATATVSATHTQSGAGTDKEAVITSATIPQAAVAIGEVVYIEVDLDEVATTYSGNPTLCRIEFEYGSTGIGDH